jgi:hypothetical protein
MDNFLSGFIAQIFYIEEKMQKFRKIPLGAFWGNFGIFWGIFWFLG